MRVGGAAYTHVIGPACEVSGPRASHRAHARGVGPTCAVRSAGNLRASVNCAPDTECPYPANRSPARRACGGIHTPTTKQPPSMLIFPHQKAEKSLQNQHVLSILQVGSHQLQYRLFRTSKPISRHTTNTFCPLTPQTRTDPGTRTRAGGTGTHEAPGFQWNPGAGSGDGGI